MIEVVEGGVVVLVGDVSWRRMHRLWAGVFGLIEMW